MTLAEVEKLYLNELIPLYETDEAKSILYYAVEHICGFSKADFMLNKKKALSPRQQTSIQLMLDELKTGRPVQYIIGETEFYGCRIRVNPAVLIPRPETEELVEWIIKELKHTKKNSNKIKILDIGTGSGCIPIALKKNIPAASVYGLDISAKAIETALQNAVLNHAEVKFIQGDILNTDFSMPAVFHVIVSNPPYICVQEKNEMHRNVLDFEPEEALFVPDSDPLLFYRHIINFAKKHLQKQGLLFFEINERFGKETTNLLKQNGFSQIELKSDFAGRDRMIKAEL